MDSRRAIAMFSGGLDSCLAVHLIKAQGVEVIALNFRTPFNVPRKSEADKDTPTRMAERLGVELERRRLEDDYIEMLRSPRYGYGRGLNPCIDCRIFLIKKAAEIMKERDAGFILTGEVVGQRPMSQRKGTIALIDAKSGYSGLILRPLSAKLLPPTMPEENGWVDREKLLDISGRTRTLQMELAEKFGITGYPSPAGGCLLTEPEYSRKLRDLFSHQDEITGRDVELLRSGRHFRLSDSVKIVVGKNDPDNRRIIELAGDDDILLLSDNVPGPATLIAGKAGPEDIKLSAEITARYINKKPEGHIRFKVSKGRDDSYATFIEVEQLEPQGVDGFRI